MTITRINVGQIRGGAQDEVLSVDSNGNPVWVDAVSVPGLKGDKGDDGVSPLTVSATAPVSPDQGDLWYDTGNTKLFLYTGSAWVEMGVDGQDGSDGTSYTFAVGSTNTIPAGSSAAVTNSGTPNAVILDFDIPKGDPGPDGDQGDPGPAGPPGSYAAVRVGSILTTDELDYDTTQYDQVNILELAEDLTVNRPTGAPDDGRKFVLRITADGGPYNLTWDQDFREVGPELPEDIAVGKLIYVGFTYNASDDVYDVVAVSKEA